MTQNYYHPELNSWSCNTGRITSSLLSVLPQADRFQRPEKTIGCEFQYLLKFDEDSSKQLMYFDYASQEMLYSALLSQNYFGGEFGSDSFLKAVLTGTKKDKTDVYSIVAESVGIKRNQAKSAVLGALYGLGKKKYIASLLGNLDTEAEKSRVAPIAEKAYEAFKGVKGRDGMLKDGLASGFFNYSTRNMAKDVPTFSPFNLPYPRTLCKKFMGDNFSHTAGINMAVQGGAATGGMLSAFITSFQLEARKEGLTQNEVRIGGSIHDAVIFLAEKEYDKVIAKCIVKAYLNSWIVVLDNFNFPVIPTKLAYDVEIDCSQCLRKDAFSTITAPLYSYYQPGYQLFLSPDTGKLHRRDEAETKGYVY